MISEKYKCIFIHIPKTAGTSMEKLLGHFKELKRGVQDHRTIREIESLYLSDLMVLAKHQGVLTAAKELKNLLRYPYRVDREKIDRYFKFTFVRNPWSRVYSWYKNIMRDEIHRKKRRVPDDCSFEKFLENHGWHTELRPQLCWIQDRRGRIRMDFIGRFENLDNDVHRVCDKLGIDADKFPHLVAGDKKDYRKYYNDKTRRIIENWYREEIEMFDYEFED